MSQKVVNSDGTMSWAIEKNPQLSILVPTTPDRDDLTRRLLKTFYKQCKVVPIECKFLFAGLEVHAIDFSVSGVSINVLIGKDDKQMSIGEKRNKLYHLAEGVYSWQIDSDDMIDDYAIQLILESLKKKPDCVTFREKCIIDGEYFSSNHSLKYPDWWNNMDGFDFVRTPFMKDVIRTDICKSVAVPDWRFGEDHAWSRLIKPHLKSEEHIDIELYHYLHNSSDHNERYGIKSQTDTI